MTTNAYHDGIVLLRRLHQQVLRLTRSSESIPSVGDGEWEDAREEETQQRTAVVPIASPQIGLLLDATHPLDTPRPYARRSSLDRSSLKIDGRAQMRSYR